MPAGYSGTPLARKLGIKPQTAVVALDAPEGYGDLLAPLPEGVTISDQLSGEAAFIHLFARHQTTLDTQLPAAVAALRRDGMLWISWPKKASGLETDVDREAVRARGLAAGLVDTKVCAVDETWSGLRFVYRLTDR